MPSKPILIFQDVLEAVRASQGIKRVKVRYEPQNDAVMVTRYSDEDITYDFGKSYVHPSMIKHNVDPDYEYEELKGDELDKYIEEHYSDN